jgi:hypothetical protein
MSSYRVRISNVNKKEVEAFTREDAKTLKTEKDLNMFSQMLTKTAVEATLNADPWLR